MRQVWMTTHVVLMTLRVMRRVHLPMRRIRPCCSRSCARLHGLYVHSSISALCQMQPLLVCAPAVMWVLVGNVCRTRTARR
eukprot:COSAG01_NODE_2248_length_8076_cov_919.568384_6_plen_81_part_00